MRLNELHKNAISLVKIDRYSQDVFFTKKTVVSPFKNRGQTKRTDKNRINVNRST